MLSISCYIALKWIPQDLTDDQSTCYDMNIFPRHSPFMRGIQMASDANIFFFADKPNKLSNEQSICRWF